jgi:hypothetical protein
VVPWRDREIDTHHQGLETRRHSVKHNQSTSRDQMTRATQGIPEMGRGREMHRIPRHCAAVCTPPCRRCRVAAAGDKVL